MIDYPTLKMLHIGSAILSISGFVVRGAMMFGNSPLIWNKWTRSLPHLVDTLLLISGIWLAVILQVYPGGSAWLSAKIIALLAYIGLGFYALRLGKTKTVRSAAFLGALLCFAYMAAVAITKNVLPSVL